MAAITVTGTVTKCETRRRVDDFASGRRYAPANEFYTIRHNICLTDATGRRFYFDGPAVRETVANAPGCAVVIYHLDGDAGNWFRETGGRKVATAEQSNDNRLESLVKVGDTLTVRASVKATKPGYTAPNRVKMVKPGEPKAKRSRVLSPEDAAYYGVTPTEQDAAAPVLPCMDDTAAVS